MCFLHQEFHDLTAKSAAGLKRAIASIVPKHMGHFAKLPPEVRAEIWQLLQIGPKENSGGETGKFGILLACRELYGEVSEHRYRNEIFTFHLCPMPTYDMTFAMTSGGLCRMLKDKDMADGCFRFVPYKRFQCIEIEIEAPDRWEPRSFTMAWTKVRDVVELLAQVDELPNIDIYLLETGPSWSTFLRRREAAPLDIEEPDRFWHHFDFKEVLMPFFELRNVRKICIHCLPGLVPGDIVLGNAVRGMEQAEYVLPSNSGSHWDYTHGRKDLEHIQFLFENTLHLLSEPTANFMRVETFAT
jgi:hypothetical protein